LPLDTHPIWTEVFVFWTNPIFAKLVEAVWLHPVLYYPLILDSVNVELSYASALARLGVK